MGRGGLLSRLTIVSGLGPVGIRLRQPEHTTSRRGPRAGSRAELQASRAGRRAVLRAFHSGGRGCMWGAWY